MSSSFTDQPSPHDPRHEEGYTPTPPVPKRGRDEDEIDDDRPKPRLGSLAQKARGNKLKEARGILLTIGILTTLVNGFMFVAIPSTVDGMVSQEVAKAGGNNRVNPVEVQQFRTQLLVTNYAITGLFLGMGILFVIFGLLVYRFPLAMTITSFVLYLLATLAMLGLAAIEGNSAVVGAGSVVRIVFLVALGKSIQSAYAYEKKRRAEDEYQIAG